MEKRQQSVITLEPPYWRCENGNEFRCGHRKPPRCPVCGSTNIEMVVEIDADGWINGRPPERGENVN